MFEEAASEARDGLLRKQNRTFGPFVFDPRRPELRRNGMRISMSASQMRLLAVFMERPGELVTRAEIAACLWTDTGTIDVDNGINTAVNRLRRNLQVSPQGASPIETVIGVGYRFDPELVSSSASDKAVTRTQLAMEEPGAVLSSPLEEALSTPLQEAMQEDIAPEVVHETDSKDVARPCLPDVHAPAWWKRRWPAALGVCGIVLLTAAGFWAKSRPRVPPKSVSEASAARLPRLAPLTHFGPDYEEGKLTAIAVSPSGQSLAYADSYGISVHSFVTSRKRLVSWRPSFTIDRLSWAPDERSLLVSGTDETLHQKQVWSAPVGGYVELVLTDASRAALSPDGSTVAFTRAADRELWLAAATGQQPRLLRKAPDGQRFDFVLWSPAGNRLLATMHKERPRADERSLTNPSRGAAYEYLDAATGSPVHRQEDFAATTGYILNDGSFFFVNTSATASPTVGGSIMMAKLDLATGRLVHAPLRVRDLETRRAQSISASQIGLRTAALLQSDDVDGFVADLKRAGPQLNPELSGVTRLTQGLQQVFPHSWTADGKAILVESDPKKPPAGERSRAIYRQPIDGKEPTLLARLTGAAAMAQLSPDGRWVLFLEFASSLQHVAGIFRVPVSGGMIQRVATSGEVVEFRCSASTAGRCVVREAVGDHEFIYYDLDPIQGMGEPLLRTAWQPSLLGDWNLSADGSTIVVASHDTLYPHLSIFRLRGGSSPVQDLALVGHGTALGAGWAPDGRSLFVEAQVKSGYELIWLDLQGRSHVLRTSPKQIWAVPSRDGRKIAFPAPTSASSLWITSDDVL